MRGADHRISAFRATDLAEAHDDDGEDRAGSSLLSALRSDDAVGISAVVARWYGGVNIGKARFQHIKERVHAALRSVGQKPGVPIEALWQTLDGRVLGGTSVALSVEDRRARAAAAAECRMGAGTHVPTASCSARQPAHEPAAGGALTTKPVVAGDEGDGESRQGTLSADLAAVAGSARLFAEPPSLERSQLVCPCCTLHNLSGTVTCEACGSVLPSAPASNANSASEVVELLSDSD